MLNYSHLGTLRFTAAHVDHFSKATGCSYQHCLPCAVTILGYIFSKNNFHVYGVENWHVWHSGDSIYLPLRTTWSLPLLAKIRIPIHIIKPYCGDGFDCFGINRNTTIISLHFIFSDLSAFSSPNKTPQQFNKPIYGSGS